MCARVHSSLSAFGRYAIGLRIARVQRGCVPCPLAVASSTIDLALFELFARNFASITHALTVPSELSVKTTIPGGASWFSELAKQHKLPLNSPELKILAEQAREDPGRFAELREEARQSRSQRNASSLEQQQTIEKKLIKLLKSCPPGHNFVLVSHSLNQQTFLGSGDPELQRQLLKLGNEHLVPAHCQLREVPASLWCRMRLLHANRNDAD
jgi:hypothetical protein